MVARVGESGEVERRSWTKESVGKPFELIGRDPAVDRESIVPAWSGDRFVFVYTHQGDRRTLWMESAVCR